MKIVEDLFRFTAHFCVLTCQSFQWAIRFTPSDTDWLVFFLSFFFPLRELIVTNVEFLHRFSRTLSSPHSNSCPPRLNFQLVTVWQMDLTRWYSICSFFLSFFPLFFFFFLPLYRRIFLWLGGVKGRNGEKAKQRFLCVGISCFL